MGTCGLLDRAGREWAPTTVLTVQWDVPASTSKRWMFLRCSRRLRGQLVVPAVCSLHVVVFVRSFFTLTFITSTHRLQLVVVLTASTIYLVAAATMFNLLGVFFCGCPASLS
jgi:hypothetical protein